jgi:hypothetical protein
VIPHSWRYLWRNSADPRVNRAHAVVDAAIAARPLLVRSIGEPNGPVIAYGGLPTGVLHVLDFLEQQRGGQSVRTKHHATWSELKGTARPDVDLLAVGCRAGALPPRIPAGGLLAPLRITLSVPTFSDPDTVLPRISRKARQQHIRELAARKRTLQVATDVADFDKFYDEMHRPTMAHRHGAATRSESRRTALVCLFRRGKLFFLLESGERVAGMLCRLEGTTLVIRLAGVQDGTPRAYESGTYMALYIMIIQWAAAHGITRVDLSGCEPFLSKGLFQFKRKMHPDVTLPRNHFADKRLVYRALRDRPEVRDFLVANPVLMSAGGTRLEAVYFHDEQRSARLDLRWKCSGVSGHRLVHLDEFLAGLPTAAARAPVPGG